MFHCKPRTLLLRPALPVLLLGGGGTGVALLMFCSSASALPESVTQCTGWLTHDSAGKAVGEPDLLDYGFFCNTGISAYTIVVDRLRDDGDNIDDYNPNPEVVSAGQVSGTESVNCGGVTPSNGIDCYTLQGATAGLLNPGDSAEGAVDLTDQYCGYLPKGARSGTPAVPRATVELIVTDNTGAQDGPFELHPVKACPKVPAVVPQPVKAKAKAPSKQAAKRIGAAK